MPHLDEGTLTALLDHELEPAARQAAEDHLTGCRECRALYQEIQGLAVEADQLIATVELPANPSPSTPTVPAPSGYRWSRWRPVAWAASVVLALGLGWSSSKLTARRGDAVASVPTAEVAAGGTDAPAAADDALGKTSAPPPAAAPSPAPKAQLDRDVTVGRTERERFAQTEQTDRRERDAKAAVTLPAEKQDAAEVVTDGVPVQVSAGPVNVPAPAAAPAAPAVTAQIRGRRVAGVEAKDEAPIRLTESSLEETPGILTEITLEDAVGRLGGSIRLLGGLVPVRVLCGSAPGFDSGRTGGIIRLVYVDPPGRELWLDQAVAAPADEARQGFGQRSMNPLLPGDTLALSSGDAARSIRWIDDTGRSLRLTGFLATDSLRTLMTRVR